MQNRFAAFSAVPEPIKYNAVSVFQATDFLLHCFFGFGELLTAFLPSKAEDKFFSFQQAYLVLPSSCWVVFAVTVAHSEL